MKKSFMRRVCLVLSLLMVFTLVFAGCSQKTSNAPAPADSGQQSPNAAPSEGAAPEAPAAASYKIGVNNLVKGAYALDVLEDTARFATLTLGSEFFSVNDEGKIEKVVQDVQSMIAAGCDGIEIFCVVETLFPVVAKACQDAKVPFVFYDKVPASEETREALKNNPYFVGAVGSQNYQAGQAIGKAAVDAGCKKAIIVAAQQGDPTHDPRIQGFTDVFEAAGGKVLGVTHGPANMEENITKADDLMTAHPDIDCVYGSGGDFATAAITALKNHKDIKAKVFATDLDPSLLQRLKAGELTAANGAHFVNATFTTAMLINYLDGHPIKDENGNAPIIETLQVPVLPAEWADLYQKFWIDGYPYSEEEIKMLAYRNNPNITYQDYVDGISNYTIEERLMKKMEEGSVTEAELKSVGVIK